jgi:ribosomal protein S18 acetylase RimI-like enzyme
MTVGSAQFTTKELTRATLPDFERFMQARPAPGAFTCWCMYHQVTPAEAAASHRMSRSKLVSQNRRKKKELVENDLSHGILVYSVREPVGWCQYGSWKELPRFDHFRRSTRPGGDPEKLWRITCFTVDRRYRSQGVAKIALRAALDSIRRKGGGLVEAYPITRWGAYREYLGTVSMFKKEGFEVVTKFGDNNAIVRREV